VKVLDFGISKTNPFGESEHDMTRTASMLGSPRFMSPEQMRDPRAVDGRSDIWSLGVVLYRLVSGRPPFEADTLGRLLTMVMHEAHAPLASVRRDLPPGFSEVVSRCLEKDPTTRFANVAELAYALVPFAADPTRARSAADRIAAVLSVPHTPVTGDASVPVMVEPERASMPPGASDTGTAAPWAGTHGGTRQKSNTQTIALLFASVVLVVGTLTYAKLWSGASTSASKAPPSATVATAATATALPSPTVLAPSTAEPTATVAPIPAEPPRVATVLGASPMPSATAPRSETPPQTKRTTPGGSRTKAASRTTSAPKPDEGIPSSRE
jgi:serine/threonine-protein kinase